MVDLVPDMELSDLRIFSICEWSNLNAEDKFKISL